LFGVVVAVEQGRQCRRRSMDGGADDNGQKEGRKEGEKEKERTARRLLTHMSLLVVVLMMERALPYFTNNTFCQ